MLVLESGGGEGIASNAVALFPSPRVPSQGNKAAALEAREGRAHNGNAYLKLAYRYM